MALTKLVKVKAPAADANYMVTAVPTIEDLRSIPTPTASHRVTTQGAFSVGDGGNGSWVFELGDQSANVSAYPRVFIAPADNPTGAAGAWRPNAGKRIDSISCGFAISGLDTAAGDTWPEQAAGAAAINKEILEQLALWNAGRRLIILPPRVAYTSSYRFASVDPKLVGTPGTSTATGTFLLTHDALSTEPVIDIGTTSSRISGLVLRDICMASYKFFSTPSYNTFTDARDNRIGWRIRFCGTHVKVDGLYAAGYARGFYVDELWDGYFNNCRALYCSTPTGASPGVFIGTSSSDNSNNLQINHLHIEFSPYALEVGFCEHVTFNSMKVEAYRQAGATHNLIVLQPQATKVNINDSMIVTNNATTTHAVLDAAQFPKWNQCWFAGADDANYPQAGIHWYRRVAPANSQAELNGCHFNRCHVADGSDPLDYSIYLNNYTKFSGQVRVSPTYNTSSGTVTTVNAGVICLGTSCSLGTVHLIMGSSAKAAGPTFYATGAGNRVERVTQTSGDSIFRLWGGDANASIGSYGFPYQTVSTPVIYTYGKRCIFLATATAVTQLYGFVGDEITIVSNVVGSTLVYGASTIVTSTNADVSMSVGRPYKLTMVSGTKAVASV